MSTEYDCPNCGAHVVRSGRVLGLPDSEVEPVALDALSDVRTIVFDHVGRDTEFYDRWLGPTVTDPEQIPAMVEEALAEK